MITEWSLDALYKSYDSKEFKEDFASVEKLIQEFNKFVNAMSHENDLACLKQYIDYQEKITLLLSKLFSYLYLSNSTNTSDAKLSSLIGQLETVASNLAKSSAKVTRFVYETDSLLTLIQSDDQLKGYEYYFKRMLADASHTLSEDVEDVIAKLNQSAASAWSMLQQYVTSTVTVDYDGKEITLSDVRNLAYDKDASVRKKAYDAELECYKKINDSVSFSLNNIKSQVNTISELRGFSSPLEMTLFNSDMKAETLDALMTAIKEYLPKFREYIKFKGKLLGSENGLAWYDLFAPIGESHMKFDAEEAKDFLLELFGDFSTDLKEMAQEAFETGWVDFYPKKGKVGGAFCQNLPFLKQSRVLTNFDGSLSSVVTLAHELGHAYHGLHIQEHLPLNTEYSMQIAETASTFNENIVMDAVIKKADDKEKIALIESQLQDLTQIIVDIYSRFVFEKTVFERRKSEFLFSDDLCKIMIDAQKEAFGDSIIESTLHPYMWICKSHYYNADYNYYNYPYAFGGLFAKGLYEQFKKEGKDFVPKYQALLNATTIHSTEEIAQMAGIDITTPDFWKQSLASIAKSIDEFIALNSK